MDAYYKTLNRIKLPDGIVLTKSQTYQIDQIHVSIDNKVLIILTFSDEVSSPSVTIASGSEFLDMQYTHQTAKLVSKGVDQFGYYLWQISANIQQK